MSLKDRLAALTPEQRRELAQRLKQQQQQAPAQKPAPPARRKEGVFPLSENQWSMWFLHQLAPRSPSYNVALALRVRGPVDPAMLERSLNMLAERHAILRTTYETYEEKPVQRVHARLPLVLTRHAAPGLTEEQLDGQLRASYVQPFDLERGPVWRADLFTRAPTEHVLLLVIHHIATDLWSMGMMMEELQHLYRGELSGEPVHLPPLKLDYVDSVLLRREQMTPARQEQLWQYWQAQMKELPGPLELPTDMPRPARWSFRGATLPLRLGPELSTGLKSLARAEGKTLYTVLLAGFLTLVHRYTGQSDILCGSPLWGRTHPDLQRLAGYFVNFVALRGDMSGDPPFTELVDRLSRRVLGAIEHQDYPFHVLCERLGVKQDPSRPRLVEVEFSFDQFNSMPGLDVARDDVQMELKPFLQQQEGQFAINLMLVDVAGEVAGALKYNTDLFTPETMARFAAQLRVLLTSVLRNPRQRLSALSLLTETDRRQLLEGFNATQQGFPPRSSVQSLFEEHAARAPEKPAVACEGRQLSYGELDARANQLAWRLRGLGVKPETCVALCLERSVEMVESILGTWKAGGAYVPLDPALPAERLRTLLAEVAAPVVVTESAKAEVFASLPVRVVCLDTEEASLAALPTHAPPCELHADNVAYVLFTSGSTGRPKGVAVAHGHLLNYVRSIIERLHLGSCESFAMVSTFAADLGNTVLFPALCLGGLLHVMSKDRASSPQGMADYFQRHGVDCLKIVPSHLAALMTANEPRDVLPRKRLVMGGEASTWALVERVRTLMPSCEVYNHYGPTETTVGVVCGKAEPQKPELAQATVPLGRPIANTRLYVLDGGLRPTPLGVPGELYISGDSVTRGYLGRPEQTAERFLPDPFSPRPGARMYRTGDRARWLADGRVEFLGRADFQVKIRGFRVELGEIEATLRALPSVKEAVVLAVGETSDSRRLVAYLTGQAGSASLEVEAVRRGLCERLPEYMVPSSFLALDALPLTPNGKLDRKALPVPETAQVLSAEKYVAPRTPTEEILVGLFAQVLGLPAVGVHDDFFSLGGHSLLAMRLVSRLRSALGVEVPLRGLFEAPTAAKLAVRVAELQRQGGGAQVPPVRRVVREGSAPVSFAQQRLWFLDQLMPGQVSYNVPIVLRLTGALDVETLRRTMEEVVRRHESLRTTFTSLEDQPRQVIHPMARLELPVVPLEHLPATEREAEALRLSAEEVGQPFDLARGPLHRARLLRLGDTEYVLAMTVHHIVSDGWSLGVMVRELVALYEAFSEGRPSPLPELPVQYADYAHWQRQWMTGPVLEQQLGYWRRALAGVTPLELPTDKPRPAMQRYRGATFAFALPRPLAEGLKGLARQEGATLFMVLLSAFQALLHRYSGQDDITVGTPVAGRNQPELEGLIGFFVNTLALRTRLGGNPMFREVLAQVKETTLGAYAHQDIPFEKLVEALEPERDLSRQPLFQVAFILQNVPASDLLLPGVAVRRELVDTHSSKFDLSLSLTETAEGLSGSLEYSTDLYEAGTVERMVRHFQVLLESAAARPDARVSELRLLDEAERQQVLVAWNPMPVEASSAACVQELFEAQADRTPDALAVACGGQHLTYRQLDQRANRLAHRLRRLGVGPEVRVGLWMERSVDMVVGMLATLKAGGAYVPVDTDYPEARARLLLEDSGLSVLLSEQPLLKRLASLPGGAVGLALDTEDLGAESDARPARVTVPDNAAYVIYTSGSTGRPKGVVVEHRHLWHLLRWHLEAYSVEPGDRASQVASPAFDAAVWEIWPYLVSGAALELPDRDTRIEPARLVGWLAERGITVAFLPTPLCEAVLAERWPADTRLRWLLTGGDKLSRRPPPDASFRLVNHYGPTEATVVATAGEVSATGEGREPSIGGPITPARVYVLDEQLVPQPVGVPGELYVAGAGVARGYLERPDQTAERFLPDLFSGEPGARMYRTGDRVKWREDGQLEYLGRIDFQVKVRGFRIELGEVEDGLRRHPGVQDAVVVAKGEGANKRLVGYVSVKAGQRVEAGELQEMLKQHLPRFMVPSALMVLEVMPLSPNGKIDRKALPEPEWSHGHEGGAALAPRDRTEMELVSIFEALLGMRPVGVRDDFFALGGHSLLTVRLVAQIERQLGKKLPLNRFFGNATVESLATVLRDAPAAGPSSPLATLQPRGNLPPLFFVHAIGGSAMSFRELSQALGEQQPLHAFHAPGLDGEAPPFEDIPSMARHYLSTLRESHVPGSPLWLAGWSFGGLVAYEMARQLEAGGVDVSGVILLDSWLPRPAWPVRPDDSDGLRHLARELGLEVDADATLSRLAALAVERRLLPPATAEDDLRRALHVYMAHQAALRSFRPEPSKGLRLVLLRPEQVSSPVQAALLEQDPTGGWSALVPGPVELHGVPGDHFRMLRAPHVEALAQVLRGILRQPESTPQPEVA